MRIIKIASNIIPLNKMEDGQIGVIKIWPIEKHIGTIVQRCGANLIALGKPAGDGWSGMFASYQDVNLSQFQVEILPPGTVIEI